jgi:hypothetical protein
MHELRSLHSTRQVRADDDVVMTHFLDSAHARGGQTGAMATSSRGEGIQRKVSVNYDEP